MLLGCGEATGPRQRAPAVKAVARNRFGFSAKERLGPRPWPKPQKRLLLFGVVFLFLSPSFSGTLGGGPFCGWF